MSVVDLPLVLSYHLSVFSIVRLQQTNKLDSVIDIFAQMVTEFNNTIFVKKDDLIFSHTPHK